MSEVGAFEEKTSWIISYTIKASLKFKKELNDVEEIKTSYLEKKNHLLQKHPLVTHNVF